MRGLGCQRGGALEEGSDGRQSAARLRPSGGALELGGDLLVGHGRRLRPVPGAAIRVELRIGCVRQRAVDLASLVRLGRAVDRRANQRMTERHRAVERQQAFRLDGVRGRLRDPELPRRAPQERRVAERLGRRQEQQPPRVAREPRQPPREALLDPGGQRQRRRQAEPAGELGGRQPARQLQQRERIAARLGDDPLQHRFVQPRREDGLQQRPRIPAAQRLDAELREAGPSHAPSSRVANTSAILSASRRRATNASARADAPSSHCASSTTHSSGCSSAASDSRPRTASPTRNGLGAVSGAQPERDAERLALGVGQTLDELEDRRAELLQRRVGELHLPLDARGPDDPKVLARLDRVLEQRGLADARLAVHHQHAAVAVARGVQQPLEHRALALPAEQPPCLRTSANHPRSMPPGSRTKDFLDSIDGDDGQHEVRCTPWRHRNTGSRPGRP